jgi:signal transduction histidine kinase
MGVWILLAALSGAAPAGEFPGTGTNSTAGGASVLDAESGVGSWIWDEETHGRQECHFWRTFEIPAGATVRQARLRITAHNSYHLLLDNHEVGWGSNWRSLIEYDLSLLLKPGTHVLAVIGFNDFNSTGVFLGGVLLGLRVELTDGRVIEIASDQSWLVVPNDERGWEKKIRPSPKWRAARVVAAVGKAPWGERSSRTIFHAPILHPVTAHYWQSGWFQITLASLCAAVILVCLYLASRLLLQSQAQLVVQRERARIARDIHDDLTGGLTQLVLLGETTRNDLPDRSETRAQVGQICDETRGLLRAMNEVVWLINSQRDTLRDFASYICKCAETFLAPTPIRCRFDIEQELPATACDVGIRRNLLLGVKEALHNVVRHAQAKEVFLRIHRRGQEIVVSVEDDGRGFDPASADRERNGLSNMMRRAAEAGGVCRILSRPGAGCRVEFQVPLAHPRRYLEWLSRHWGSWGREAGWPAAPPGESVSTASKTPTSA